MAKVMINWDRYLVGYRLVTSIFVNLITLNVDLLVLEFIACQPGFADWETQKRRRLDVD